MRVTQVDRPKVQRWGGDITRDPEQKLRVPRYEDPIIDGRNNGKKSIQRGQSLCQEFCSKMSRFEIIVFVVVLMFLDMGLYDFLAFVSLLSFIAIFRLRH